VPVEEQIVLSVNAIDLVGLMCTPVMVEELALGFLYNEGLIDGLQDVADVRVCGTGGCVDVWLERDVEVPDMRIITSGCSGGTTFESLVDARPPVTAEIEIGVEHVAALTDRLRAAADLYHRTRGIHSSALADRGGLICVAEDVGRHNTLDKIAGTCLRQELEMRGRILLTTGRVSSEMLHKAARMEVPLVISLTSPTSLSVELARAWDITLIGYARGDAFRVYAVQRRVVGL
jgi:FdhD protein